MTQMQDRAPVPGQEVAPLLEVKDLKMHFPVTSGLILQRKIGAIKAVDGVSFSIPRGQTLGLVGESGSGKTTVGRCIIQLNEPTSGEVWLDGVELTTAKGRQLRGMRRRMQMVFQDPYSSLNPRMSIGTIIGEPMLVHKITSGKGELKEQVSELLRVVGLNPSMADRYPHEFSGGQRQRIGIARAIAVRPDFIVADEPVSALDVSIQAQLINLLEDIQEQFNLTFLFIAHDLSVVRHMSENVAVMYLGKIMEMAERSELYEKPLHPYTQALLSAVPVPNPRVEAQRERIVLQGTIPSPMNAPSGCVFHTRCPIAIDDCRVVVPELKEYSPGHWAACIRV
ncbi:MAG: ATP-binding cassette domain-containing protein [Chloroflexota bacterium]|nr:ATP-binding cassette domain-containing protein [Chloroflexota bacterium]MDE2900152.1 ATP-binding cassette domain-containing protein [Chloroflexota bacterium]MDE2968537.1 ATP-binding cassette domain-containing protein [Chloroflexota bacterium]